MILKLGQVGPSFGIPSFKIISGWRRLNNVLPEFEDLENDIRNKINIFLNKQSVEEMQKYISSEQVFSIAGVHIIRNIEDKNNIIIGWLFFNVFYDFVF